jgi:hypothetical protein
MDLSKLLSSIDDDILKQVIDGCEGKMGEPFTKKKIEIEVEPESEMSKAPEAENDVSEDELDELMRSYEG